MATGERARTDREIARRGLLSQISLAGSAADGSGATMFLAREAVKTFREPALNYCPIRFRARPASRTLADGLYFGRGASLPSPPPLPAPRPRRAV